MRLLLVWLVAAVIGLAPPAAAQAPAPSAEQRALAQRLVTLSQGPNMRKELDQQIETMMSNLPADKGEEAAWFREHVPAMTVTMVERILSRLTEVYALTFAADELEAQIAFFETPIGRRVAARSMDLGGQVAGVIGEAQLAFMTELQTKYCAEFECEMPIAQDSRSKN